MQDHPKPLINYLLIISKGDQVFTRIGLAFFATIKNQHCFWNLTRAGIVIKIKTTDFPEWTENEYHFKIVQG